MYKMKIVLDTEKITKEGLYNIDTLNDAIEALFKKRDMISDENGWRTGEFSSCSSMVRTLSKLDWFIDNCREWKLWDLNHDSIEDGLLYYKSKRGEKVV